MKLYKSNQCIGAFFVEYSFISDGGIEQILRNYEPR